MKLPISIIFILFSYTSMFSQKEDEKWVFNWSNIDSCDLYSSYPEICGASILDFQKLPPICYRDEGLTLDMASCNSSICDENGQLLFYCNGQSIHGENNEPIINGDTINYSAKWDWLTFQNENGENKPSGMKYVQGAGIFEIPDSDNMYTVLYHNYENSEEGSYELWQSNVQKNANGRYEVIEKDLVVNTNIRVPGNIHSCTHANGRDQWILQFGNDTIYTYILTQQGLIFDRLQFLPFKLRDSNGQSKFSRNGNKFALFGRHLQQSITGSDLMIADFNRCTGEISLPIFSQIDSNNAASSNSGLEFSEDGNLLYISYGFKIIQFDTNDIDFFESGIVVSEILDFDCEVEGSIISFGQMNLAIDNKIYIGMSAQCFQLHVIEFPNLRGLQCDVVLNSIKMPTYHRGTIPNFNTYRLGPLDGSPCDTLGIDNNPISRFWYEQDSTNHQEIQFRDVSYYRPETWAWTFGDGNTSDEVSPLHTYASNGVYEICLTVSNENSSNTSCQELQIGPVSNQNVQQEYDINIFPNPVEDVTRLVFHNYLPEGARIILYDATGKKVFSSRVFQECMIDLSGVRAGAYLYEVLDGEMFLGSGKLVKI